MSRLCRLASGGICDSFGSSYSFGGQKISYFAGPQIREARFLPILIWGGNALVGRYEESKGSDDPYFKVLIYPTEKATTNWHSDGRDNFFIQLAAFATL
ncbi:MAG: hypothetical protein CMD54_00610 [Gammaproteobacteria bacterium]|nr:hypothetical protein [Gammaproteobacteria bacterium]